VTSNWKPVSEDWVNSHPRNPISCRLLHGLYFLFSSCVSGGRCLPRTVSRSLAYLGVCAHELMEPGGAESWLDRLTAMQPSSGEHKCGADVDMHE